MESRRALRYGVATFAIFWTVVAQYAVLDYLYANLLGGFFPSLPGLTLTNSLLVFVALFAGTTIIGYLQFGSLSRFVVWVAKKADQLLGWSLFETPLLIGRLKYDGVAWRLHYKSGEEIEAQYRECPFCGLELVEGYLSSQQVHGPNSAFNTPTDEREIASNAWEDVIGKEKVDDQAETQALTCPDCDFSIPGDPDVLEGKDAVEAKFKHHVDRMRTRNPTKNSFQSYTAQARERYERDPKPGEIWDEYVSEHDDEDLLFVCLNLRDSQFTASHDDADDPTGATS